MHTITATSGELSASTTISVLNSAPTVGTKATATTSSLKTANLSVSANDDGGPSNLTYTWQVTPMSPGATSATFSANGTSTSYDAVATFASAGTYEVTATITDAEGLSTTSSTTVEVEQVLTSVVVTAASSFSSLDTAATAQFSADAQDQFGNDMSPQPNITWTATSGTIDSSGLYTAPNMATSGVSVRATASDLGSDSSAWGYSSSFDITSFAPTVAVAAGAAESPVTGTSTTLSVLGADDAGEANLTYTWEATTVPGDADSPSFSSSGSNAAKKTTVTFYGAGDYVFTVTIVNPSGRSTTSDVGIEVDQTATTITVTADEGANALALSAGASQGFSATVLDQFGKTITSPSLKWSAQLGSVDSSGNYTAPAGSSTDSVTVQSGNASASVAVGDTGSSPFSYAQVEADHAPITSSNTQMNSFSYTTANDGTMSGSYTTTSNASATISTSDASTVTIVTVYSYVSTFSGSGSYTDGAPGEDGGGIAGHRRRSRRDRDLHPGLLDIRWRS